VCTGRASGTWSRCRIAAYDQRNRGIAHHHHPDSALCAPARCTRRVVSASAANQQSEHSLSLVAAASGPHQASAGTGRHERSPAAPVADSCYADQTFSTLFSYAYCTIPPSPLVLGPAKTASPVCISYPSPPHYRPRAWQATLPPPALKAVHQRRGAHHRQYELRVPLVCL
jgi:hypothetical protein